MSQSYVNFMYHIVFSTKDREPILTEPCRVKLYEYIGGPSCNEHGIAMAINGTEDHIHFLARLCQDKAVSDVTRGFKANASGRMHNILPGSRQFSWQGGYGAFTVSASQVERVRRYMINQARHHRKQSFK